MRNLEQCKYTYVHKKIMEYMVEKYCVDEYVKTEMLKRIKNHDMDKLTSYLFYPKPVAAKNHRANMPHHVNNDLNKDMFDYIEMVFDWESARYSKSDKPMNAYDALYAYYPELEDKILPILKGFNLAKPTNGFEEDILNYSLKLQKEVNEDLIIEEIIEYIKRLKDFEEETF